MAKERSLNNNEIRTEECLEPQKGKNIGIGRNKNKYYRLNSRVYLKLYVIIAVKTPSD